MKQLQFAFLVLISFLFAACGDDDGLVADAGSGKLTATLDGQSWESKDEINGAVYSEAQGTHQIQAYHEDDSYIGLTFFGAITSGMTIDGSGGEFQAQYKPDFMGSEIYTSLLATDMASITFSTFSESKVKGTFSFIGVKANPDGTTTELVVQNGSFDIDL
jgi:hypothetical protein